MLDSIRLGLTTAAVLAAISAPAQAITMDFTSGGGQGVASAIGAPCCTLINAYTEDGMLISVPAPNHIELFPPLGGAWSDGVSPGALPWHRGGSNAIVPNVLDFTFGGGAFNMVDLTVVANPNGMTFTSDGGGVLAIGAGVVGLVSFLGAGWTNITDFDVEITAGGAGDSAIHSIDRVNFTVPEPGSLALFGLALAGLGFSRRKQS